MIVRATLLAVALAVPLAGAVEAAAHGVTHWASLDEKQVASASSSITGEWSTFGNADSHWLVFNNSEGRRLRFYCKKQGGWVAIEHDAVTPLDTPIALASGAARTSYHLPASLGQGTLIQFNDDDAIISALRGSGRLDVAAGGRTLSVTVEPEFRPLFDAYFDSCESA